MFYTTILAGPAQIHQLGVTSALDIGHEYSRCVCVSNVHFPEADCVLQDYQSYLKQDEVGSPEDDW